jgi:hypothetical protein
MIDNMTPKRLFQALLCVLFIFSSTLASADMYKYLTKDGKTVLTGKRLNGSGNKLLKVYRIKKAGAYKSSAKSKQIASISNKFKTKKIRSKKYRTTKRKKSKSTRLPINMVKANGRDSGVIVGCNNNKHLGRQARLYKNTIQIY